MTDTAPKAKAEKTTGPAADDQDATVGTAPAKTTTADTTKDGPKPKTR